MSEREAGGNPEYLKSFIVSFPKYGAYPDSRVDMASGASPVRENLKRDEIPAKPARSKDMGTCV
jgi:hypothetical protein